MNKEFIADLITELSYRLLDGTPDLTKNDHLIVLRQVMKEKGLSYDLIEKTMKNLRTPVKKNPNSTSPTKFSVDFDGVHSDQAESMPYIDAYQAQDRADQDKLPMDDRDDEERDTPADESVNELDYLDDEDDITETDLVKKKESGNVYDVDKFDPGRGQALIKKDASAEDIAKAEKGEPVEKEKDVEPSDEKQELSPEKKNELRNADSRQADHVLSFTKEAYKKRKEELKKAGKEDVGAGTAKSRAGEAATHYAIRQIKEGKSIDDIRSALMNIANEKGTFLDKIWVDASLNATVKIIKKYGIDNIDEVVWDTSSGRKLIGTEGHGTSSDMFITTKDGKRIGISLKQSGKVFLSNSGYAKSLDALTSNFSDEEKSKIENVIGSQTHVADTMKHTTNAVAALAGDLKNEFQKSLKEYKSNPKLAEQVFEADYKKYLSILDNFDSLVEKVNSGKRLSGDETKAIARVVGKRTNIYKQRPELYDNLNLADNRLTGRLLNSFNENPKFAMNMKKFIMDKVHITDILDLKHNPNLDEFTTIYGEKPDGAELSKESLLELFGEKAQILYEIKEGFQKAKTPEERKKKAAQVMKQIENSIYIDFKDGARTGEIKIKHEDGKEYPIFTVATRARGIGAAPALEIYQADYMTSALKNKSFDVDNWTPKERVKFLTKLKAEHEQKYADNKGNPEGQKELQDGIRKIDAKLKKGD